MTVDSLCSQHMPKKKEKKESYSSWFSWRRKPHDGTTPTPTPPTGMSESELATSKSVSILFTVFPPLMTSCCLLSHLPTYFGSLYCKYYEPRSDCSLKSSLIRVHIVCFQDESKCSLKCIWIYAADVKSRRHFQDQEILAGWGLSVYWLLVWVHLNVCSRRK